MWREGRVMRSAQSVYGRLSLIGEHTILVELLQVIFSMTNLPNRNGALRERRLLSVVPLKLNAILLVDDGISRNRGVMASSDQHRLVP